MNRGDRLQLPPSAYQTFSLHSTPDSTVKAACEEVGCAAWRHGWQSLIDERTVLGRAQAHYIRTEARRTYHETRTGDGLTVFTFESRQRCFAEHSTRPEIYLVRGGDWRADLGLIRRHVRPADWIEDLGEHLEIRNQDKQRG